MYLCFNVFMRTTLDLPDPLFRELKARAAQRGLKMKQLLTSFVESGLRGELGSVPIPRTRSSLPVARRFKGKVIPAMSNAAVQQLMDEEDAHGRS
jgi:hypothetical protein